MLSHTEENYLKAIYKLQEREGGNVSTNSLAEFVQTTPASVTDMIKRLSGKNLVIYEKYNGVRLGEKGIKVATLQIRKHRLWETFLVQKLNFNWDQIHAIANQLEHTHSEELTNRLDEFLGHPKFDPHGDPIPDKNGKITLRNHIPLSRLGMHETGSLQYVKDANDKLLKHLSNAGIRIGSSIKIVDRVQYDNSVITLLDEEHKVNLSAAVSSQLFVKKSN